jgi:prophage antirepressor-like protein
MSDLAKFQDTVLDIIHTPYGKALTAKDIGTALGYVRGSDQVAKLHREHHTELEEGKHWSWYDLDSKTTLRHFGVTPENRKGMPPRSTRIYYQSGANLLAMFARTSAAKAFRRWAADILTDVQQGQLSYDAPVPTNLRNRLLAELAQRDLSDVPTPKLLELLESAGD